MTGVLQLTLKKFAYKAERLLKDVDIQIYDKNADVGGTWLENRYPGCTCDIPSHSYQFTWAKNPRWSHYYSSSPEIWQYFKDVAVKYDLEKYMKLNTTVDSATWEEDAGVWRLRLHDADGKHFEDTCNVLVNGSGVLNEFRWPKIPGLDTFQGKKMHSARWDADYDMKGKKVAVIGGGSSAVQIIPNIQKEVDQLYAFLRSPVWITTGFGAKVSLDSAAETYSTADWILVRRPRRHELRLFEGADQRLREQPGST